MVFIQLLIVLPIHWKHPSTFGDVIIHRKCNSSEAGSHTHTHRYTRYDFYRYCHHFITFRFDFINMMKCSVQKCGESDKSESDFFCCWEKRRMKTVKKFEPIKCKPISSSLTVFHPKWNYGYCIWGNNNKNIRTITLFTQLGYLII